jgi:hypothetical protein
VLAMNFKKKIYITTMLFLLLNKKLYASTIGPIVKLKIGSTTYKVYALNLCFKKKNILIGIF